MSRWLNPTAAITISRLGHTDWAEGIDALLDDAFTHWELTPTRRLDGGALSVVVACDSTNGPAVVKLAIPATGAAEADTIVAWTAAHPDAAVAQLLDRHGDVLLLEMIDGPGTPTAELAGNLDTETERLAPILHTIAATPAAGAVPTNVWVQHQTAKAVGRFIDTGHHHLIDDMADRAAELIAACRARAGTERLCHGDLWHHNVLRRNDGTWVMIDPAGMAAGVEADIAFWSVCAQWGLRVPERLERLCGIVDADINIARRWAAWQCLDRAGVALAYNFDVERRIPQLLNAHDEVLADPAWR